MNKSTTFFTIAAIATFAGIAISTGLQTSASEVDTTTSATQSAPEQLGWFGHRRVNHKESFANVKSAIEANDFTAFQGATKDTPLATQITTQEQFDKLVQMHKLKSEGKTDEAKALADELGLSKMQGGGMHGDPAKKEAVKTALTNNDFTAFQKAIADDVNSPLTSIDTAEKFAKLVEMNTLFDKARAIRDELGLSELHEKNGNKRMRKGGMGFGKMMR